MQSTGCDKLDQDLQAFERLVTFQPSSADELATVLRETSARVAQADLASYDAEAIRHHGIHAFDDTFLMRAALRERVPDWQAAGFMTRDVQFALRGVFRDSRYAADMLAELFSGFQQDDASSAHEQAFSGNTPALLLNPRYDAVEFRSGDVLLVRGIAANSAAIARIGDVDSQFSHIGLVHVAGDGTTSIVEALIESGSVSTPLAKALDHDLARAVLFRPRDRSLGEAAAALAKAHVEKSNRGRLPHVPYDFGMEMRDYRSLFCSKLIRFAYSSASDGEVVLPAFNTRLDMGNRDFFERIGVTATETFAPADVELEPVFDIVAEWRDLGKTALVRNQDAVMDMIFYWMETHGYVFRETMWIKILSRLGRLSAYLPRWLMRTLAPKLPDVPMNMTRSTIAAIAMLHKTAAPMTELMMERERETNRKSGRPMHPRTAYELLEDYRKKHGRKIGYLEIPGRT